MIREWRIHYRRSVLSIKSLMLIPLLNVFFAARRSIDRIMWIVLVLVMALSGASGINMSIRLGKLDHHGAKQAGHVGVGMASSVCLVVAIVVWVFVRAFGRIFTNDPVFLDMFEETRTPFVITLFLMNLSVTIEKIPYAMGRTTEVFWLGLIASWGGELVWYRSLYSTAPPGIPSCFSFIPASTSKAQVPAVILCTMYWRDDLIGLYTGMGIGYGVLVVLYSAIAFTRCVFVSRV